MIDGRIDRRAGLVGAAISVVAEVGFEGLRLRRVAAAVGIDQSTLHHWFATKADLVEAVALAVTTRLATTAPPERGTPDERLGAHLAELAAVMRREPDLFTVAAELDLHARRDPAVRTLVERQEAGWRRALVATLTGVAVDDVPAAPPSLPEDRGSAWDDADLVVATVKGVRCSPEQADHVLRRLAQVLTGGPA